MSIYLDHAATTPMLPEVREEWVRVSATVGNASSIHADGQQARRVLEDARERLAEVLNCEPIEVVFTSGGTEAVGLSLAGLWRGSVESGGALVLPDGEHHATLESAQDLAEHDGARIVSVGLDRNGRIPVSEFAAALPGAALATAIAANNEVGTVNDIGALAAAAASERVPLHVDAVSAFGHVPVSFRGWRGESAPGVGLVALSVAAHKLGGPIGVGAAVLARHAMVRPLLRGGGQQRGLRAGTQDVAGAAAFALAAELAAARMDSERIRLRALRQRLIGTVTGSIEGARLLGDPDRRLPGNVHLLLEGALGETLLFLLDREGISVSTGSACQAGVSEPSHVVLALGYGQDAARQVLRVSMGQLTTAEDVDAFTAALPAAVRTARRSAGS